VLFTGCEVDITWIRDSRLWES